MAQPISNDRKYRIKCSEIYLKIIKMSVLLTGSLFFMNLLMQKMRLQTQMHVQLAQKSQPIVGKKIGMF